MTLSEELKWRGFVNQTTYKDLSVLNGDPVTFYWGVDPSASSMQIGNLAAAMMVRHFIDHGHKAVLLIGGATGLIGDPDGKKDERELKDVSVIADNVQNIVSQYKTIFDGQNFELVNNFDWFKDIHYLEFLRDIGKHLSMTQLLDREFVKARIGKEGTGLSYAEFSYSLIQGYDFLHLFREKGVTLQVCGADQWGNSLAGVEMIRKLEGKEAHVYSTSLIVNKTTGVKFGKSEQGAIWLDEKLTSPYKFYQFWLNLDDAGIVDYLKIYTLLTKEEIEQLEEATKANPHARKAQETLAYEVTKMVHGEERAKQARNVSRALFSDGGSVALSQTELEMLSLEIPAIKAERVVEALVTSGLATSNGEAKRLIDGGAISVNGEKVSADTQLKSPCLIKKGKNSFILVR